MSKKDWVSTHNGCQIRVTNSWFGSAKLYIDGECRDTNSDMFVSSRAPALSARMTPATGDPFLVVEVYLKALVTVKVKICVDGKQISGDVFN
jgi:hypothetical protein